MIRRIALGVGANLFSKLVVSGVQLVMVPVLASHWGLAVYGSWLLLATIPGFLITSDFGFSGAAGTRMTMLIAAGRREEALCSYQSGWLVLVALSGIVMSIALVATWLVPQGVLPTARGLGDLESRETLTLLTLWGILAMQSDVAASAFRSTQRFALASFIGALSQLAESGAAIACVIGGGRPVHAAAAMLVVRAVSTVYIWLRLRRTVPWLKVGRSAATRAEMRLLLPLALPLTLFPLGQAAFLQGTALALGAAAGVAAVPSFTAVRTLSRIGLQFTQLLNLAMMPEFSAAVGRGDGRAQSLMVVAIMAVSALVTLPFFALFAAFGVRGVALWTRGAILPEHGLVLAFAFSLLFGGLWNPLSNLLLAMNRQAAFTYPFAVLALIATPLAYGLSLMFGVVGTGMSVALLDVAMCGVVLVGARRILPNRATTLAALRTLIERGRMVAPRRLRPRG